MKDEIEVWLRENVLPAIQAAVDDWAVEDVAYEAAMALMIEHYPGCTITIERPIQIEDGVAKVRALVIPPLGNIKIRFSASGDA